jgi:hypothetical protein
MKGQQIGVPVLAVNRDPRIWGPDAAEFKCIFVVPSYLSILMASFYVAPTDGTPSPLPQAESPACGRTSLASSAAGITASATVSLSQR